MGSELIRSKPKRQAGLHMFVRSSQGWGTCGHILKEVPTLVLYLTHYNGRIDHQNLVPHPNNEMYIHDKIEVALFKADDFARVPQFIPQKPNTISQSKIMPSK